MPAPGLTRQRPSLTWAMNLSTLILLVSWRARRPHRNSYSGGLLLGIFLYSKYLSGEESNQLGLQPGGPAAALKAPRWPLPGPQAAAQLLQGDCPGPPAGGPLPSARPGFLPPTLRPSRPWAVGRAQQPQGGVCEEVGGDACRVFVHRKATSFVPLVTMTRIPVGCVVNRGAISSGPLL